MHRQKEGAMILHFSPEEIQIGAHELELETHQFNDGSRLVLSVSAIELLKGWRTAWLRGVLVLHPEAVSSPVQAIDQTPGPGLYRATLVTGNPPNTAAEALARIESVLVPPTRRTRESELCYAIH
jgi:hypothetical protein